MEEKKMGWKKNLQFEDCLEDVGEYTFFFYAPLRFAFKVVISSKNHKQKYMANPQKKTEV